MSNVDAPNYLRGLSELAGRQSLTALLKLQDEMTLFEDDHPFDLDLPAPHPHVGDVSDVRYLDNGVTDHCVDAMLQILRYLLGEAPEGISLLREIQIQCEPDQPKHHILFEVWTIHGVFITGACTDCSGEGGRGATRLRGVFHLVQKVTGKEYKTVTIPFDEGQKMLQRASDAWSQQFQSE